jgi:hypothetical protein
MIFVYGYFNIKMGRALFLLPNTNAITYFTSKNTFKLMQQLQKAIKELATKMER